MRQNALQPKPYAACTAVDHGAAKIDQGDVNVFGSMRAVGRHVVHDGLQDCGCVLRHHFCNKAILKKKNASSSPNPKP